MREREQRDDTKNEDTDIQRRAEQPRDTRLTRRGEASEPAKSELQCVSERKHGQWRLLVDLLRRSPSFLQKCFHIQLQRSRHQYSHLKSKHPSIPSIPSSTLLPVLSGPTLTLPSPPHPPAEHARLLGGAARAVAMHPAALAPPPVARFVARHPLAAIYRLSS